MNGFNDKLFEFIAVLSCTLIFVPLGVSAVQKMSLNDELAPASYGSDIYVPFLTFLQNQNFQFSSPVHGDWPRAPPKSTTKFVL